MRNAIFLAAIMFATPLVAEDIAMSAMLGHTMEEVKASLVEMGYEVRKAEQEDGKIEVYFVRDNEKGEVYVDPQTGLVTKLTMK